MLALSVFKKTKGTGFAYNKALKITPFGRSDAFTRGGFAIMPHVNAPLSLMLCVSGKLKLMSTKIKASKGDLFSIQLSSETFALGQIVETVGDLLYLVVFSQKFESEIRDFNIEKMEIALASLSTDAKIWHGHWPILGNTRKNLNSIPKPFFKVHFYEEDQYFIESLTKDSIRPALDEELSKYPNRFSITPKRLENATKAYFGFETWDERFNKLKFHA